MDIPVFKAKIRVVLKPETAERTSDTILNSQGVDEVNGSGETIEVIVSCQGITERPLKTIVEKISSLNGVEKVEYISGPILAQFFQA